MRITCAIIDDEPEARELVRNLLERYFPAFEILGETDNLDDAAKLLDNESLDLVFLDIQLYDRNIFEISDKLSQLQAKIIFITAYNHFALNAFRVNAVDYLLNNLQRFSRICRARGATK
jgi:two-component system, LytTR family, response regulator